MNHGKLSYEQEQELTNQLLNALDGRWDLVLPSVIPDIHDAIKAGPRRHVNCILLAHGGKDDFRITKDFAQAGICICSCTLGNPIRSGIDLVQRVLGCNFITAKRLLVDALHEFDNYKASIDNSSPNRNYTPPERPVREVDYAAMEKEATATKNAISRIWNETLPLNDPTAKPAIKWFHNRGLLPLKWPLADIRFHPSLRYYYGDEYLGDFPAIVAMIRDNEGKSKTIHRTYITPDGRKPEQIPPGNTRKLFTVPSGLTASGSAVRFDEPTNCLNLAEGIETALTARTLTGMPTWSCLSKDLLRNVEIPEHVRYITIWADKDKSDAGQSAAMELVERLRAEGRHAVALLPPGEILEGAKSLDWNDLIISRGAQSLREDWQYRQWDKIMQSYLAEDAAPSSASNVPSDDEILANAFTS